MATKKTENNETPVLTDEEIAMANAAQEAEALAQAEADKPEAPKAPKTSKKSVNLDKKLANQGTFAVGVQAMMRNRINKRG